MNASKKEIALYAALTTVWWISSASVLLPFVILLKCSKRFRNRWFSWIYTHVSVPYIEPSMLPLRKECFQILKEHLDSNLSSVRILEIGIGSGANLEFYPKNSRLVALDCNASFDAYFFENLKKYPQITFERSVLSTAEDMNEIESNSMDVVVSTYVMCSVNDIDAVLKEAKRVLKPAGKFLFLEHVAFPNNEWGFLIQRTVSPLWALYFGGCYPHRNISEHVDGAGFSKVNYKKVLPPSMDLFVRPHVVGIAERIVPITKRKTTRVPITDDLAFFLSSTGSILSNLNG